jgi:hypothetical protein
MKIESDSQVYEPNLHPIKFRELTKYFKDKCWFVPQDASFELLLTLYSKKL